MGTAPRLPGFTPRPKRASPARRANSQTVVSTTARTAPTTAAFKLPSPACFGKVSARRTRASNGGHAYVQSQFVGQLINRRKRYPAGLRDVLARCLILRQTADYAPDDVTETRAARTLQRARAFVEALYVEGGDQ